MLAVSPAKWVLDAFEMSARRKKTGPGWLDRVKLRIKKMLGMNVFLCDTCKWDWRSACHHPERPNATWCPDYDKRGT